MKNSKIRKDLSIIPTYNYDEVILLETLGEDFSVKMQKAFHKQKEKYVSIKTFNEFTDESVDQIILEDEILKKIEKINIQNSSDSSQFLKYYGAFKDPKGIHQKAVLFEMESGLSTLDDILNAGKKFGLPELLHVLRGLIKDLALLQQNGIANRNIKPGNIILVEKEKLEGQFFYKISDFSIGCELQENCNVISCSDLSGFAEAYAAPEIIKINNDPGFFDSYNPYVADVYSLGIVALKMIEYSLGKKNLESSLLSRKEVFPEEYGIFLSVLQQMLEEDPKKRMDFNFLHAFIEEKIQFGFLNNVIFDFQKQNKNEKIQFFYDLWVKKDEEKPGKTIKDLERMFEKHKKLYEAFNQNFSRQKQAFHHLNKAWQILFEE